MAEKKTKFCKHCGAKINEKAEICPKCGVRVKDPPARPEKKRSGVAAFLSFLIPGVGQVYNGEVGKGIVFIVIGTILVFSMYIVIGFILFPIFWIYSIYDAYEVANKINTGKIKI